MLSIHTVLLWWGHSPIYTRLGAWCQNLLPSSYLHRSKSNVKEMLAEGERNFGEKHSTRCPQRLLSCPPRPKYPRTFMPQKRAISVQARARTGCTPDRGVVPGWGWTLTFWIPPLFLSDARLSNALGGCSLFIFLFIFFFFPSCGSKCLNVFFDFRKLRAEGGMLLESVTQKKRFRFTAISSTRRQLH